MNETNEGVGVSGTDRFQIPLLLILDEPAAALDASAEHDLFERYASSAGQAGREDGGITVLISHRQLVTDPGLYAELFTLQARAYR